MSETALRKNELRPWLGKLFLAGWVVAHGVMVAALIAWVPIIFWVPVFGFELLTGYFFVFCLFGATPSDKI
jgi:hypothetical protein